MCIFENKITNKPVSHKEYDFSGYMSLLEILFGSFLRRTLILSGFKSERGKNATQTFKRVPNSHYAASLTLYTPPHL